MTHSPDFVEVLGGALGEDAIMPGQEQASMIHIDPQDFNAVLGLAYLAGRSDQLHDSLGDGKKRFVHADELGRVVDAVCERFEFTNVAEGLMRNFKTFRGKLRKGK